MSTSLRQLLQQLPATQLGASRSPAESEASFSLSSLQGRITELSGESACASLSLAAQLIYQAQCAHMLVAWLELPGSHFFAPDLVSNGVDLRALTVVRAPDAQRAAWQADRLVRSGAFSLVILDLFADAKLPSQLLSRLNGLASTHMCAVVCLSRKPATAESLGALISLRATSHSSKRADGCFDVHLQILRDKRHGGSSPIHEVFHAPFGRG